MLDVSLVSLSYVFPSLLTREPYVRRQASLSLHAFFSPSLQEGLRLDVRLVSLSYVSPSLLTTEAYVRRQASLSIHAFPSLLTRGA